MIEIEAKFKLASDITRDNLIAILKSQFIAPISSKRQIDTVFLLPEQVDAPIMPGSKIMRVRDVLNPETGELQRSLMTLKVEGQAKLASDEYEFVVDDGNVARQMLTALGWQKSLRLIKSALSQKPKITQFALMKLLCLGYLLSWKF